MIRAAKVAAAAVLMWFTVETHAVAKSAEAAGNDVRNTAMQLGAALFVCACIFMGVKVLGSRRAGEIAGSVGKLVLAGFLILVPFAVIALIKTTGQDWFG